MNNSHRSSSSESFWKRKFIYDIFIALTIIFLPFTVYIHLLFDENSNFIMFFGLKIVHGYDDIQSFTWHVLIKSIPFLLLLVWYLHTIYWWRHVLIIPMIFWIDSLIRDTFYLPEFSINENVLSVFTCMCVLMIIFLIDRYVDSDLRKPKISIKTHDLLFANEILFNRIKNLTNKKGKNTNINQLKNLLTSKEGLRSLISEFTIIRPKIGYRILDLAIVSTLIVLPLIFYAYNFIPIGTKELNIWGLIIKDHGFNDVNTFVWLFGLKTCIILPLGLWFITCLHWWKYAILSPILIVSYELWESMQTNTEFLNEIDLLTKSFMVLFCVLAFLLAISKIVRQRYQTLIINDQISYEIEKQIKDLGNSNTIDDKKKQLKVLRNEISLGKNLNENIVGLIKLSAEIEVELNYFNNIIRNEPKSKK